MEVAVTVERDGGRVCILTSVLHPLHLSKVRTKGTKQNRSKASKQLYEISEIMNGR